MLMRGWIDYQAFTQIVFVTVTAHKRRENKLLLMSKEQIEDLASQAAIEREVKFRRNFILNLAKKSRF